MLRVTSAALQRTSRRGPGGWTTPTMGTFGRGALESQAAQRDGPKDYAARAPPSPSPSSSSRRASAGYGNSNSGGGGNVRSSVEERGGDSRSSTPLSFLSSSSFYDLGDNANEYAKGEGGAAFNNWRTDRRFSTIPSGFKEAGLRGQAFSTASGSSGVSDPGDIGNARRVARDPAATVEQIKSTGTDTNQTDGSTPGGAEPSASTPSWLGGTNHGSSTADPSMSRSRGINNFSMIDRDQVTLTTFMKMMMDATFQPRDTDSRVYGGDNKSKMAEQREELKNLDSRIVPFAHESLMNDYLKNIQQLSSPSGQLTSRDMLKGRLVGLLFFSEGERSFRFMRMLKRFHKKHSPDFVVVAISAGGKEMMDVTRGFGFFHCTHRDGATWVKRDAGIMIRPFVPLPRLVVVDGSTGQEITRSGVTAVAARSDTCFSEWKRGGSGVREWDFFKSWTI